jgi:hypothetical protein
MIGNHISQAFDKLDQTFLVKQITQLYEHHWRLLWYTELPNNLNNGQIETKNKKKCGDRLSKYAHARQKLQFKSRKLV